MLIKSATVIMKRTADYIQVEGMLLMINYRGTGYVTINCHGSCCYNKLPWYRIRYFTIDRGTGHVTMLLDILFMIVNYRILDMLFTINYHDTGYVVYSKPP